MKYAFFLGLLFANFSEAKCVDVPLRDGVSGKICADVSGSTLDHPTYLNSKGIPHGLKPTACLADYVCDRFRFHEAAYIEKARGANARVTGIEFNTTGEALVIGQGGGHGRLTTIQLIDCE